MSKNGSLTYQIKQMDVDFHKVHKSGEIGSKSRKLYLNHAIKFGEWCKKKYGCKTPEECRSYIQDYSDWLVAQNKSASTVHTYIAGVCRWWNVPMEEITGRPQRVASEYIRSRGVKKVDSRSDAQPEVSPRLFSLARCVGARRAEYGRLLETDLVIDESGYECVRIRRGKGGKYQEQRILPEDLEFVRSYFDGSNSHVFSRAELDNKLDLHHLRALLAQRAYKYYMDRIDNEPGYKEKLAEEIKARWLARNRKPWQDKYIQGNYYLRGKNREFALANSLPTSYLRLATLAVSMFFLSHWRCDVTVCSYLLAI